jgi:Ca-activated chloride channel family protein
MGMRRQNTSQRRATAIVVVLGGLLSLCCLVAVIGFAVNRQNTAPAANGPAGSAPADPHSATLTIAYSPEKAALMKSLAEKFNAKNLRTPDRQAMRVELTELAPEDMVTQALANPSFQALTPDSSLWLDQLNRRWAQSQQGQATPGQIGARLTGDPVRYAVTPIVIAAWEDAARALGWPNQAVSWSSLQSRAQADPNFKWSHPSTSYASGLLATLAEFYAGAGVQRGLTVEMAQDPKTLAFVSGVEKSVAHYGEGELGVIQQAIKGEKGLNAFVVSEQIVVAFNTGVFGNPPARLVALYPSEGTLWADHPLALLETPNVTDNQRRTFQALRDFLAQADVQTLILQAGYRPADLNVPLDGPGSPLTAANGVDPKQPQTTLQLPSADVVSVVQSAWEGAKRRANVMLVVDTSGSMRGDKLANTQKALRTFLAQIPSDQERVGLVEFNSHVTNIVELDTLAKNRSALSDDIDQMQATGNTALLDAVNTAYNRLQQEADPSRINAIVAMTDGRENASNIDLNQLAQRISEGNQKVPVVIFCVAYGADADFSMLQSLADASGGQVREGTPDTIQNLYKLLSSYF